MKCAYTEQNFAPWLICPGSLKSLLLGGVFKLCFIGRQSVWSAPVR